MPRLVLLPGLDGTGALFAPFLRVWNGGPAPLVIDYPRDRFLDYAAAVEHVRARLPDEPVALVAESFSGPVGIALAARHPERIATLVLCATFATSPRKGPLRALLHAAAPLVFRAPAPPFLVGEVLLNGCADRELLALVCGNKGTVSPAVMTRRLRAVLACDARDDLARIDRPVLYLQAARDRLVPPAAAAEIRAIQPHATIVRLDSPHFVLQAAPAESASAITAFLAGCGFGSKGL